MSKGIKITLSFFLLAVILFAAVPKVYIHSALGHNHNSQKHSVDENSFFNFSEDSETQDCNFEKFDTPVYYTVFKFILNFLPLKESKQTSFLEYQSTVISPLPIVNSLRGPPIA
jgi:hypothetical protein